MKIRFLPGLLLVFLLTACTFSRPLNLHGLKNAPFEDPVLRPDYDLYGLRIDIIRQTHDESETDSTSTTEDDPYHQLGFDLGNGLFFDYNSNLGLRIDRLLAVEPGKSYTLREIFNVPKGRGNTYAFEAGEFCRNSHIPPKDGADYCYSIEEEGHRITMGNRRGPVFYIERRDTALVYSGRPAKDKQIREIVTAGEDRYEIPQKRKSAFSLDENGINLNNWYLIKASDDGRKLEIYAGRRGKQRLLYTLERTENTLLVYNRKKYGMLIRLQDNRLDLVRNDKVIRRYELVEKEGALGQVDGRTPDQ